MDETLRDKTAATARLNALSILVIAGLATLWAGAQGDSVALFGVAVCVAAASELRGAERLRTDPPAALPMLIGAEIALLVLIVGYSLWRLAGFDFDAELAALPSASRDMLIGLVADDEDLLRQLMTLVNRVTYSVLLVATLIYQGGMAIFYRRRIARIVEGAPA